MAGKFVFFFGREGAVRQGKQLGEADDGVQRGPHFVGHVLDKAGLGRVGQPYALVGFLQFPDLLRVLEPDFLQGTDLDDGKEEDGHQDQHDQQQEDARDPFHGPGFFLQVAPELAVADLGVDFREAGHVVFRQEALYPRHQVLFDDESIC